MELNLKRFKEIQKALKKLIEFNNEENSDLLFLIKLVNDLLLENTKLKTENSFLKKETK